MKYSRSFEKDWEFYFNNIKSFNFAGTDIKITYNIQYPNDANDANGFDDNGNIIPWRVPFSDKGSDAKKVFHKLDSQGKGSSCKEPELLVNILTCKSSVNLNIKIWAEGWAECSVDELEIKKMMEYYNAPDWVFIAINNQKYKILKHMIDNKKYLFHNFFSEALSLHYLSDFSSDKKKL